MKRRPSYHNRRPESKRGHENSGRRRENHKINPIQGHRYKNNRHNYTQQVKQQQQNNEFKFKKLPMPNFSTMEDYKKEQYWIKYNMHISRARDNNTYLQRIIPEIKEKNYNDLPVLHVQYDTVLDYFMKQMDVTHYKTYMVVFWTIIELLGYFMDYMTGINISGFLKLQMRSISHYENIIWEISETAPLNIGAGWHPMFKLALFSIGTAIALAFVNFIIKRYIGGSEERSESIVDGIVSFISRASKPPSVVGAAGGPPVPPSPDNLNEIPNPGNDIGGMPDVSSFFGGFNPMSMMQNGGFKSLMPLLQTMMGGGDEGENRAQRERKNVQREGRRRGR